MFVRFYCISRNELAISGELEYLQTKMGICQINEGIHNAGDFLGNMDN